MSERISDKTGRLLVISGPSGSGKSTLARRAVDCTGARLSVSATTRPPGTGEQNGKDYYFMTRQEFENKINAGEFLEYAEVFGNFYGTPAGPVHEQIDRGETVILEIDVQGALQVFQRFPDALGILIMPPSYHELENRLTRRGRDDDETIRQRLAKARWETEQARQCPNFRHTIINEDLEQAVDMLVRFITPRPNP